ncbi:MAG: transposon-transfer assisting family protein [bacterium]|nr:transposon-transfer assisting family protein [bacterium]
MTNLTHDEMNLLCIYQKNTRIGTMDAITVMRQYLEQDETELWEMSDSLLGKLEQMSDEEFDEMEKFPDFNY